jgi:hypothetical protein
MKITRKISFIEGKFQLFFAVLKNGVSSFLYEKFFKQFFVVSTPI